MAEINEDEEAFPVLLRRIKSEPDEDLVTDKSFDEVDSQFSQQLNSQESEGDLDYIITNEDGEELYEFQSPVTYVSPSKASPKKKKRKSPESTAKRRQRCGLCGPCQVKSNCGECGNCLRRSVLKQSCIYRKCLYLRKAKNPVQTKEPLSHSAPSVQPKQKDDDSYVDDTELMPDDTAMLERPMVLLSPDSRGSPDQTNPESNETPLIVSRDSADGDLTSDPASLPSATENAIQPMENSTHPMENSTQPMQDTRSEHMLKSSDPMNNSLCNSANSMESTSPPHGESDSEDKGVQSKDFFMNTILNQDSEEQFQNDLIPDVPVERPPSRPENMLHRPYFSPHLPFQRFPVGPEMPLQRPYFGPEMQFDSSQNFGVQREILRRKIMERSFSQENTQIPNVVDWKKDYETGGKSLPSWKAFGSYNRTEERHVVKGILENASRRKNNKPKRLCKFFPDSEKEADLNAKKRRLSHSPSNQSEESHSLSNRATPHSQFGDSPSPSIQPEWRYINAHSNSVTPKPQFPGAENNRYPYPMFDKVPPWQPLQDYNMHHRDLDPRMMYPPTPPQSFYMGRFSQYPNQMTNHHMGVIRGLVPPTPNYDGKWSSPYRSEKCEPGSGDGFHQQRTSLHRENTPPFSKDKCNIPPEDLQRSQRTLFHNPFQNFTKDMEFAGYGRLPDKHVTPGLEGFSPEMDMYRLNNSHVMACPENRLERYPFSPYQGPRMFSPWMPHGIPMNGTRTLPGPYPPFHPRIPNCVTERPVTRPPPPLRIPNFRPKSQTSNGSRGQTPTMPELERGAESHKHSKNSCEDLTSSVKEDKRPPMDAHLKRYLDDVYKNQKCFPARPPSLSSKSSENQKLEPFESRFEQEMISIDDFHVSAYIRADGANSVEIEFDQSSIIGDHSSIGDPYIESQSSSESSPMFMRRRFSEHSVNNQKRCDSAYVEELVCKEILINGSCFKIGLKGTVNGNVNIEQDLGDGFIVQLEIPGDDFIVENVLLESKLTSSSSNIQELIQFVKGEQMCKD